MEKVQQTLIAYVERDRDLSTRSIVTPPVNLAFHILERWFCPRFLNCLSIIRIGSLYLNPLDKARVAIIGGLADFILGAKCLNKTVCEHSFNTLWEMVKLLFTMHALVFVDFLFDP